jgi:aminoglycoside phosphotransferase (APT) family kinase protein
VAAVSGTVLDPADAARLRRVLPGRRITAAEPLGGGYRNENIRLVTDGGGYVLRRYLRGDAARTCAIEAALAARLAAEAVPAAEVIAADGRWSISAVLDWEFAFSGSPLTDIGNMLRFGDQIPEPFGPEFIAGYQAAGGELPARWRQISQALDLYALADFLTRPPDHEFVGQAAAVIRDRLQAAGLR